MSTILLVDDDVHSLSLLQIILVGHGHRVLLAQGGEAALHTAAQRLPDLIVTDWNMPGMDGIGLCERLKSYPALAQIPVVMTSGRVPPREKSALWDAFLSKPLDLAALEHAVDSLLVKRLSGPQSPQCAWSRVLPMATRLLETDGLAIGGVRDADGVRCEFAPTPQIAVRQLLATVMKTVQGGTQ